MSYFEGPQKCRIAIVGEAPGAEEVRFQRPFVGAAGKLLNRMLDGVGIQRQLCYIDNVFQKRPPNNDASQWLNLSKKYAVETDEYRSAVPALQARLDGVSANVIVALGNTALYTLTGRKGITKYRGSVMHSDLLGGRKVIPTIHPSAALRTYLDTHLITHDMRLAIDHSFDPNLEPMERRLTIKPTFDECLVWLDHLRFDGVPFVAFDIEVTKKEVSHISFASNGAKAICIPFLYQGRDYFTPPQEAEIWQKIAGLLEDEKVTKIGQNVAFDATFLYRKFGIQAKPLEDTMIAMALVFPDYPKGLHFIQSLYCKGQLYYKDDGKEWWKFDEGEESFLRYSAMDSAIVAEAWPRLVADLNGQENWPAYVEQRELLNPLIFMGEHGVRMNWEGLTTAAKQGEERIGQLEEELAEEVGRKDFNYRSVPQMKAHFYGTLGLRPYTKKGVVTTDDKALKRLAAKGIKAADIVLKLRHETKLHGTYYTMQLDDDKRLRCSFNPVGTKQTRISSSKTIFGTGGNMQNQPPEIDALMLPDPGYVFISQDLSMAENRVVAVIAPEPRMLEAFDKHIDMHRLTGSLLRGVPIEEVTDLIRAEGKRANHGLNYDLGFRTFAIYYGIDETTAKHIVDRYHNVYPGVRQWHAKVRDELKRTRTLVNLFGRKRIFMDRWDDKLFKEAYSFVPQSSVAHQMNKFGIKFIYERQDLFAETCISLTKHDSITYQVPLSIGWDKIAETILTVKASLETPLEWMGRSFSIPADTKVGFDMNEKTMAEIKAINAGAPNPIMASADRLATHLEGTYADHPSVSAHN